MAGFAVQFWTNTHGMKSEVGRQGGRGVDFTLFDPLFLAYANSPLDSEHLEYT